MIGAVSPQRPARWHPPLPDGPLCYSQAPSDWLPCFQALIRDRYDCRIRQSAHFGFPRSQVPLVLPVVRSHRPREARPMRLDVVEPVSSFSGCSMWERCDSPSLPRYPHMPLPRSPIPAWPPCTWPAPRFGGDLFCAWRCCPPLQDEEDPDDMPVFGIQLRGFDTCSIRFVRPLRLRYAMFASEWLPTSLGWEC